MCAYLYTISFNRSAQKIVNFLLTMQFDANLSLCNYKNIEEVKSGNRWTNYKYTIFAKQI